ncbi:MAG: TIGR01777 family protein [Verrucomicrobia bacterium]|nr:MAG: TIGR01777 family protein [Verrucomicrobiota bacterium]
MKVLVTGATGLVGSALVPYLTTQGHEVVRLSRSGAPGMFRWEPESGRIEAAALEGVDAIVNLAGANIAEGRWTSKRRRLILESRVQSTRALVEAMATMEKPPSVFVNASAVGIYGDTGDREVDESAGVRRGFLAEVCRRWEAEARRAETLGVRTVLPRLGVVLTPSGGALAKLLPLFRSGLGGPVGGGRQWMSWIAMDDLLEVLLRLLTDRSMTGPVNAVTPTPVTNGEFAHTLARVLGRPSVVPTPAIALRLAFGQMATETMLASSRVKPARLLEAGHAFLHGELEPALRHLLGRERSC